MASLEIAEALRELVQVQKRMVQSQGAHSRNLLQVTCDLSDSITGVHTKVVKISKDLASLRERVAGLESKSNQDPTDEDPSDEDSPDEDTLSHDTLDAQDFTEEDPQDPNDPSDQDQSDEESDLTQSLPTLVMSETADKVLPYIPVLFNGDTGVCGWVPVGCEVNGHYGTVVIVSAVAIEWILQSEGVVVETDAILECLRENLIVMQPSTDMFVQMMLCTPFKVVVRGGVPIGAEQSGILIVPSESFKKFLGAIRAHYFSRPDRITAKVGKFLKWSIGQRYAMTKEWRGLGDSRPVAELHGSTLSYEERSRVPSFGIPWWKELYSRGAQEFFGLHGSVVKHVARGEFCPQSVDVVPFADFVRSYMKVDAQNKGSKRRKYGNE